MGKIQLRKKTFYSHIDVGESKSSEDDDEMGEEMMDSTLPDKGDEKGESLYCTVHTPQKGDASLKYRRLFFFATLT